MIGAIGFLMAWREFCRKYPTCQECPALKNCLAPERMKDGDINKLISIVMAWEKRQEASNEQKGYADLPAP